jgi:hypothetical protein
VATLWAALSTACDLSWCYRWCAAIHSPSHRRFHIVAISHRSNLSSDFSAQVCDLLRRACRTCGVAVGAHRCVQALCNPSSPILPTHPFSAFLPSQRSNQLSLTVLVQPTASSCRLRCTFLPISTVRLVETARLTSPFLSFEVSECSSSSCTGSSCSLSATGT